MNEWLLIISMAIITFGIRYVLLASSGRWRLSSSVQRALNYVPVAVLTAIVVESIMVRDLSTSDVNWRINPGFLLAAIVAFVIARISNSLMIAVITGLTAYWLFTLW